MSLTGVLLAGACRLLPATQRAHYAAEWSAECDAIGSLHGARSSVSYAGRVLLGAPRTAFVLRTNNRPIFFDVWLMSVTMAVPALFFIIHGMVTDQLLVSTAYAALFVGLLLVASSAWSAEVGLFGGKISASGLLLVLVASVAVTVLNRFTDTQNPAVDGPIRILPGSVAAQIGVLLVMLSAWMGDLRVQVARLGLSCMTLGLVLWAALGVVNAMSVETWAERMFHLVTVPSAMAVASVCWLIRRSGSVFIAPSPMPEPALLS